MATNPSESPLPQSDNPGINRLRNFLLVVVAAILSVSVFLGFQAQTTSTSLKDLAEGSVPLEVALSNQKPTLMEFYADWCTTCQAMAEDIHQLKTEYQDRVNFVMLNVDNTKWLPEILHYRVDGIPHFVFLNSGGDSLANAIGEQPRPVLAANLEALLAGTALPYAQTQAGQISAFNAPVTTKGQTDPKSHGSQVVN